MANSTVVLDIQKRLNALGYKVREDGDLGPKTFWDNSETLNAVLSQLGGPIAVPRTEPRPTPTKTVYRRVFIDVGHGQKPNGYDPGAYHAPSGPSEHELNKIGAETLATNLRSMGIEALVSDSSLDNFDAGKAAKGYDVFVSFHHNAAANPAQYCMVAYDARYTAASSRALATLVSARVAKALGIPDKGARDMALAVLSGARSAGVPTCILVEPYFIHAQTPANPPATDMVSWSQRSGRAIADAIAEHLGVLNV
jgi:N-acetylmuramoyl-L-alanine amidase